jgi:hypothetical protein
MSMELSFREGFPMASAIKPASNIMMVVLTKATSRISSSMEREPTATKNQPKKDSFGMEYSYMEL